MSTVRLISGIYGGRKIATPSSGTHPMSERIRNSLFNILGKNVHDAEILDAFAGSGAIGLEALSRGAKRATFIERDFNAFRTLQQNIKTLGANERVTLEKESVAKWHDRNKDLLFDIIFCDPPYDDMQLSTVTMLFHHLKPNALMVLSQPGRGESLPANGVVVVDNRSYGNAALTFYRKQVNP